MEHTTVHQRTCCSCNAAHPGRGNHAGWRQRSAYLLDGSQVFVHLCSRCAARFSSEQDRTDFLDGALDDAIAFRNLRRATG